MPVVLLRWVLVRDPEGALAPKGFLCTDQAAAPTDVLRWFVRRWSMEEHGGAWRSMEEHGGAWRSMEEHGGAWRSMEVTFEEVRAHLGMETQRQWSDLAILRATPCLLGLFSLVALMACQLEARGELHVRRSAWYEKEHATFSDAPAAVRRALWRRQSFSMSDPPTETIKIPVPLLERLTEAACYTE
jgi:hypothetical protein